VKQEVMPVHETEHPSYQEIWDCHSPPKEEKSLNTLRCPVVEFFWSVQTEGKEGLWNSEERVVQNNLCTETGLGYS